MKNKRFGRKGWMAQLLAAICLVVALSGIAAAATVSGTVTNNSTKTGRVYLLVGQSMGGTTGLGVSVGPLAASGGSSSYTINGVPDGNYVMIAMLDTLGIGIPHANDPAGASAPFTVSGTPVSNVNLTLANVTPPTLIQMNAPNVMPSANGVMVEFNKPSDNNNIQLADSFNVYWSTVNTPGNSTGGGIKNIIANDRGPLFLGPSSVTPGTAYYFSEAPVVGGVEITAALSPVSAQTTIANLTGGTSISGTVNLSAISGLSSSTPLYMVAVDENSGFFVTGTGSSTPTSSQSYSITGVQPGYYSIYAILDKNNSGTFDFGTLLNRTNDKSQPIVLVPPNAPTSLPAADIALTPKNAQVKVTTTHTRSNNGDSYNLQFNIQSVNRQVVNVRIGTGGPQVSGPIDLSSSTSGEFQYWAQVPARPAVGDSYPVTVYYSDNTSEIIYAVVTAVLDTFANPTYPPANGTIPSGQFPNFAWRPAASNGYFTYQASVNNNGGGGNKSLPLYSLSGKNQSNLSIGSYSWDLSVQDDQGNQAMVQTTFTVSSPATPPSISGFTPTGKVGDTITINGSGFSTTANQNFISFNGITFNGTTFTATTVDGTGTQLAVSVPGNTPLSGPIGVTVNGVRAVSNGEFNGTILLEGYVKNKSGAGPISGATATLVENPAVTVNASGTNGLFSFSNTAGIPSGRLYSLRFSTAGVGLYLDTYSSIMSNGTDITAASPKAPTYNLFSDAELSAWGVTRTSGKGVIRTRVLNMDTGSGVNLGGATVAATSKMHPDLPYAVRYTDGAGNISLSTTSTQSSDGMFYVLDVDEGDYVTVAASKTGMAFNSSVFVTHGNAVHQGSIRGGSITTSNATLPSGNYSGTQSTMLYLGASPSDPLNLTTYYRIGFTTNGNTPSCSSGSPQPPVTINNISSTTTVKFYACNTNFGGAAESPYNTRVYNFDGIISGKITDSNGGAGIPNIPVQLYDASGNYLPKSVNTDSSGNYTLSGITSGNYKVCFYPGSTNYIQQCYNNKPDTSTADSIAVSAPNTTPNINAAMVLGGTITGRVTSNGTSGIQNVSIQLRDINGNWIPGINGTATDLNGLYTLKGIPNGSYKIYFDGQSAGYISQWYNGVANQTAATTLVVTAGNTYPGFNAQLALGGSISGRVTNSNSGIQNISVEVRDTNGNMIPGLFSTWTDFNGNYTVRSIPAGGNVKVYFNPNGTSYAYQWYNNKTTSASADPVSISAGVTTSPVNAVLIPATVPGAPTITSIIPGVGQATVNFTAPASDGGLPIFDYTVTANPVNRTSTNLGSPITVSGLTNGQLYTISVTARNNLGSGPAATISYYLPWLLFAGNDLQSAVNTAAADGVIWTNAVTAMVNTPPLLITKGVTISGGYNFDYSTVSGYTTIPGQVNIKGTGFKVIFKNIKVKAP